jgi:hypothetical protein
VTAHGKREIDLKKVGHLGGPAALKAPSLAARVSIQCSQFGYPNPGEGSKRGATANDESRAYHGE